MKVFIDLFAGLGGASQAFVHESSWTVIRLDNNPDLIPHCEGLTMCDIADVAATINLIETMLPTCRIQQLVVWASPPCYEFSNAFSAVGPTAKREGRDFEPSLELLNATLDIIHALQPDVWYVENVKGAIKHFSPVIGHDFRQQLGSFFLWGKFPLIALSESSMRHHTKPDKRHSPLRANIRACIPLDFSKAVKDSLERQRRLTDFADVPFALLRSSTHDKWFN